MKEQEKNSISPRGQEARKLRQSGLSPKEIASKMGIQIGTVYHYLYVNNSNESCSLYRARVSKMKTEKLIDDQLQHYKLPVEWKDELVKNWLVYTGARASGNRGRNSILDIDSLILLLCRRMKLPAPRELLQRVSQGCGGKRPQSGYMDALKVMDGIEIAKPLNYVQFFVRDQHLTHHVIDRCQELLNQIPSIKFVGKNPRVIAATVLYRVLVGMYSQKQVATLLGITEVAIRNNLMLFSQYNVPSFPEKNLIGIDDLKAKE